MTFYVSLPMYANQFPDETFQWNGPSWFLAVFFPPQSIFSFLNWQTKELCLYFISFYFCFTHLPGSLNFCQVWEGSSNYCPLFWVLSWPQFSSKNGRYYLSSKKAHYVSLFFLIFLPPPHFFFFLILGETDKRTLSLTFLFSFKAQMKKIWLLSVS